MVDSPEESAWLHHELGRCQLELGDFPEATELGKQAVLAAKEAGDDMWQLNGHMLIAQAQSKYK